MLLIAADLWTLLAVDHEVSEAPENPEVPVAPEVYSLRSLKLYLLDR